MADHLSLLRLLSCEGERDSVIRNVFSHCRPHPLRERRTPRATVPSTLRFLTKSVVSDLTNSMRDRADSSYEARLTRRCSLIVAVSAAVQDSSQGIYAV